jgi:hypothetical protein
MSSPRSQRIRRIVVIALAAALAVMGVVAVLSGELAFYGRSSGRLAGYGTVHVVPMALLYLGLALVIAASQLVRKSYRSMIGGAGLVLLLGALAAQMGVIFVH